MRASGRVRAWRRGCGRGGRCRRRRGRGRGRRGGGLATLGAAARGGTALGARLPALRGGLLRRGGLLLGGGLLLRARPSCPRPPAPRPALFSSSVGVAGVEAGWVTAGGSLATVLGSSPLNTPASARTAAASAAAPTTPPTMRPPLRRRPPSSSGGGAAGGSCGGAVAIVAARPRPPPQPRRCRRRAACGGRGEGCDEVALARLGFGRGRRAGGCDGVADLLGAPSEAVAEDLQRRGDGGARGERGDHRAGRTRREGRRGVGVGSLAAAHPVGRRARLARAAQQSGEALLVLGPEVALGPRGEQRRDHRRAAAGLRRAVGGGEARCAYELALGVEGADVGCVGDGVAEAAERLARRLGRPAPGAATSSQYPSTAAPRRRISAATASGSPSRTPRGVTAALTGCTRYWRARQESPAHSATRRNAVVRRP